MPVVEHGQYNLSSNFYKIVLGRVIATIDRFEIIEEHPKETVAGYGRIMVGSGRIIVGSNLARKRMSENYIGIKPQFYNDELVKMEVVASSYCKVGTVLGRI